MEKTATRDLATCHANAVYFPHRVTPPRRRRRRSGSSLVSPGAHGLQHDPGADSDELGRPGGSDTDVRGFRDSCSLQSTASDAPSKQTPAAAAYQRRWIKEEVDSQTTAFRHSQFLALTFMLEMTPVSLSRLIVRLPVSPFRTGIGLTSAPNHRERKIKGGLGCWWLLFLTSLYLHLPIPQLQLRSATCTASSRPNRG